MAGTTVNNVVDAADETCGAVLTVAGITEQRAHAAAVRVLEEARMGEQELVDFTRTWLNGPPGTLERLGAMIDLQARGQRRVLEMGQAFFQGAAEYRRDVREAMRRAVTANRTAARASVEAARERVHLMRERRLRTAMPTPPTKAITVPVTARAGINGEH